MEKIKCLACGKSLQMEETIDTFHTDDGTLEEIVAGCCPHCNGKYLWTRVYTLVKEYDIEVDE
jgi:DNA-directed RNA polymerase subunit RPC12/RpoP